MELSKSDFHDLICCGLAIGCLLVVQPLASQLRDINGTAKTPTGAPIMDAHVYIDPGTYGTDYYTTSLGTFTVSYMAGFADKYLRITKPGWEFNPPYYLITAATNANLVKNFTGAMVLPMTSGQTIDGFTAAGDASYLSILVPEGAAQLNLHYNGTADMTIVPKLGTFPTWTSARDLQEDLVLNSSSNPPLAPGKWYFGLRGTQDSTWSVQIALESASGPLTISGTVYDFFAVPYEGVTVDADTGGGIAVTNGAGEFSVEVPFNWSGNIIAWKQHEVFTPASRSYSDVQATQTSQEFQCLMSMGIVADSLLGVVELDGGGLLLADRNVDGLIDSADVEQFALID